MRQKLHLISLGCTKNLVDSEVMLGCLKDYENTNSLKEADVIIINTCGFIEAAKQESIQTILSAVNVKKESAIVVVSGCLSERYADELRQEIPEIDIITGVGDYDKIKEMLESQQSRIYKSDNVFLANENHERIISGSKIHAYIKLSEGCNQKCSFCAIPSFKGKLHSRTLESTLKEVQNLVNLGFRDFSFISQDSSSYMRDLGEKDGLVRLVKGIDSLAQNGLNIKSARILYLYPTTTSLDLIFAIRDSKVFQNYFDMPLQHVSKRVLQKMGRQGDFIHLLKAMREIPNSFIRTSFILGHPYEEERDFNELCEFISDFRFDRMNLFAFSSEEGTKSALMPQISQKIINERLKNINKIFLKQYKESLQKLVGSEIKVIIDGISNEGEYFYSARDMRFAPEIDGEILINDKEISETLDSGYYVAKITQIVGENVLGCALRKQGD